MYRQSGREVLADPLSTLGPPAPGHRTMKEVLADIESGKMQPMAAPRDANGRANAPYETLTFAPSTTPTEVGRMDMTSMPAKFVAFWSVGLRVGFDHEETMIVTRLENVRITKGVHRLIAFDRDDGPEAIKGLTSAATVSGYMVITRITEDAEVSHDMQEGGDSTAHFPIFQQHASAFSVTFYPDETPEFEGVPEGPRYENPDMLTVTASASPMMEHWGTWHV
jgi:hypothetical protein